MKTISIKLYPEINDHYVTQFLKKLKTLEIQNIKHDSDSNVITCEIVSFTPETKSFIEKFSGIKEVQLITKKRKGHK